MSKFHRNKKNKNKGQDRRAIWLLVFAGIVVIILFASF